MTNGELPALVINIAASTQRYADFSAAFAGKLRFKRVEAVPGSTLPKVAVARIVTEKIPAPKWPGALGCLLSHITALETILRLGLDHCMVLEDDARPTPHFTTDLAALGMPADYGLCFINARLNPGGAQDSARVMTADEAVRRLPEDLRAPGSDGYIVSAKGAATLLEWFDRDGFGHFPDWRLLAYCSSPATIEERPRDSTIAKLLRPLQAKYASPERLSGFVANPSLVSHANIKSDLMAESRKLEGGFD